MVQNASIRKNYLKEAALTLQYPVIGNGDLWDANNAISLIKECNLRGVMFGRPAIANPFIFKEFRTLWQNKTLKSIEERRSDLLNFMQQHLAKLQELETPQHSFVGAWKELSFWFAQNPLIGESLFEKTKILSNLNDCREVLISFAG